MYFLTNSELSEKTVFRALFKSSRFCNFLHHNKEQRGVVLFTCTPQTYFVERIWKSWTGFFLGSCYGILYTGVDLVLKTVVIVALAKVSWTRQTAWSPWRRGTFRWEWFASRNVWNMRWCVANFGGDEAMNCLANYNLQFDMSGHSW